MEEEKQERDEVLDEVAIESEKAIARPKKNVGFRSVRTRRLVMVALFAALTCVGAFIRIPIPVVPFTLQYLFTMLAGLLLGGKMGCISVCVYIAVGLVGVPVFTQGGGIGYVLQPTFGYLIGFAVGALVTGLIANRVTAPSYKRLFLASFLGLMIVYLFGMVHYYLICQFYIKNPIGIWPLVLNCFLLAVPGDIVLCIIGTLLSKRLIPYLRNQGM